MHRQPQQQRPRETINKQTAILTLQSMFENIDREVIQMVLIEGCNGNMEAAVEALLLMSEPQPSDVPQQQSSPPKRQPQPRQQQQRRNQPQRQQRQQQQQNNNNNNQNNKQIQNKNNQFYKHSVNLSDDFLRPPSYFLNLYPKEAPNGLPDPKEERSRQIQEDEIFAKALFEDSIFASDLQQHPEWVLDAVQGKEVPKTYKKNTKNMQGFGSDTVNRKRSNTDSNFFSKFKNSLSNLNRKRNNSLPNKNPNISKSKSSQDIDPSDPNARQRSLKNKIDSLGRGAKERLAKLAMKLKKNKEMKSSKKDNIKYKQFNSLDDDPFLDDPDDILDNSNIDSPRDSNCGTYVPPFVPPKPDQDL